MLSSVPELQGYIDKSQLTEDLGGTLDYCHSRWLCHRTVSLHALTVLQWPLLESLPRLPPKYHVCFQKPEVLACTQHCDTRALPPRRSRASPSW